MSEVRQKPVIEAEMEGSPPTVAYSLVQYDDGVTLRDDRGHSIATLHEDGRLHLHNSLREDVYDVSDGGYIQVRKVRPTTWMEKFLRGFDPGPNDLVLHHTCDNPTRINPLHLEPVTHRENILQGSGPAARNARKTHCKHGHEFTEENTYTYTNEDYPHGRRQCKTCVMERSGYTGPESTP